MKRMYRSEKMNRAVRELNQVHRAREAKAMCMKGKKTYNHVELKGISLILLWVLYTEAKGIIVQLGAEKEAADTSYVLGEVYRAQNKFSAAVASYTEAREIFARLRAEKEVADTSYGLGLAYHAQNEFSAAVASYTEAREIFARLEAEEEFADVVEALEEINCARTRYSNAKVFQDEGDVYRIHAKSSESEAPYTKDKEIFAHLGAEKEVADASWALGEVYCAQNDTEFSEAISTYSRAKNNFARFGAEKEVADASWALGEVYRVQNDYSEAIVLYTEAKEIFAHLGAEKEAADTSCILGEEIFTRLGAEKEVAEATWALGGIYCAQNKFSEAEASYSEASEIFTRLGAEENVVNAVQGLEAVDRARAEYSNALVLQSKGDVYRIYYAKFSEAEALYLQAKDIFARLGAEKEVASVVQGLEAVDCSRAEYSKAKALHSEGKGLRVLQPNGLSLIPFLG
ncbi:hypothetical protein FRC00_003236 [Tulasnella sp. 408]|nr:hypothetical protein FRC00_003236 [Tulasnella sp. 408]